MAAASTGRRAEANDWMEDGATMVPKVVRRKGYERSLGRSGRSVKSEGTELCGGHVGFIYIIIGRGAFVEISQASVGPNLSSVTGARGS